MIIPGFPMPVVMGAGPKSSLPAGTTWNPSDKNADIALSNGNLTAIGGGDGALEGVRATSGVSSGRHYWEYNIDNRSGAMVVGIGTAAHVLNNYVGSGPGWGWLGHAPQVRNEGDQYQPDGFPAFTTGDVIGIALNLVGLKVHFAKNGVWLGTGSVDAGTGDFSIAAGTWFPMISCQNSGDILTANFNGPFTYTPPDGFGG